MSLIVQKFGGSSVRDAARLRNAAHRIAEPYRKGNDVIAVLSAQGDTTDALIARAGELSPRPSKRELDMLLSTGEQISVALCAMALQELGVPCVSLAAWQAGIRTRGPHTEARIETVETERIKAELARRRVVLVTGFQGVNDSGDLTTLGRGGSDTSAVALAAAFRADLCQIYTDVEGVYTVDPRIVPAARKLEEISCDEMLELARQGAAVLHDRSVELARTFQIDLEVLSSLKETPGTKVKGTVRREGAAVVGMAKDTGLTEIVLTGRTESETMRRRALELLRAAEVGAETARPPEQTPETACAVLVRERDEADCLTILEQNRVELGLDRMETNAHRGKVTLVGEALLSGRHMDQVLETLRCCGVEARIWYASETRLSVLLDECSADRALRALHKDLFEKSDI